VPPRKERVPVVVDTNIIIGYYLSHSSRSANARIFQLWRDQRRLQLIVSREVVEEYLEVLARVGISQLRIDRFEERLKRRETVTYINLGGRPIESRDPDDNIMLAAALGGKLSL
jgi:predicted nucleic acid-binding protein